MPRRSFRSPRPSAPTDSLEASQFAKYDLKGKQARLPELRRSDWKGWRLHVISRRKLREAEKGHRSLGRALDAWYRTAKCAQWKNLQDVRRTYSSADGVAVGKKVFTVFNLGGNSFRLIAGINYESQTIFIKDVLTHAEYDKGDWKK